MKWLLISLFVVLCLIGGTLIYFKNRSTDMNNGGDKPAVSISIMSTNRSTSYGNVWIEDGKIVNDVTADDIAAFIEERKESWETEPQEYPTGGQNADGTLWDGTKTVTIEDVDFINAVYVEILDKFGENYTVTLAARQ